MKTFVISGAGTGIGRAMAQSLSHLHGGSRCILLGRREEPLLETQKSLSPNGESIVLSVDVSQKDQLQQKIKDLRLEAMHLSGVVANAGIGGENHYGVDDRWQEIIDVNLTGSYNLVNACLPALRANGGEYKNVVFISSILARMGVPYYSAYCASKAGVLGLMRSWASQWAREKILVNAICPGWVDTQMARQGIELLAQHQKKDFSQAHSEQMSLVPTGKMSRPEELGDFVAFLFSGQQTSMTGQELHINNGAWG